MTPDFWRQRRVFITGHTGFKGSWLSLWLHHLEANVVGYALKPPSEPNLFSLADIANHVTSIHGDILDLKNLQDSLIQASPEIVIHMAAQSLVRCSYRNPVETYATNVMGTVNLLEAIRAASSVKAVICVTSDKCYDNQGHAVPFRETDALGGYDPYSSSKGCAELVTAAYRNSYFKADADRQRSVAVATVRSGNVIGGGDFAEDRLIPDLIASFREQKDALIRNPDAIRPWQHVLDPLHGYLMLAEKLVESGEKFSGAWNFGPHEESAKPVAWIADQLCALWGDKARWKSDERSSLHEAAVLKLDIGKAKHELAWSPGIDLSAALRSIVDWEGQRHSGSDMFRVTLNQIDEFGLHFLK